RVSVSRRRKTIRVSDEEGPRRAVAVPAPVVGGVDPAKAAAFEGYELALPSRRRALAVAQHILEPPQHVASARPQRLTVGPQALALLDEALMRAHATVGLAADEKQPAGLVGRERETCVN